MSKKYYWLKLKEDFFDDDAIEWLEEQENGKEYSLFYLKLCLKSLKTDGILIRQVGEILVPYDAKKLAEITKTEFDTVIVAMEVLKKIGLIKMLENGEILLTKLNEMVGSETEWAKKKRISREKTKEDIVPTLSGHCPTEIEIEIEKEIELEQQQEIKKENVVASTLRNEIKNIIGARNIDIDSIIKLNKPIERVKEVFAFCNKHEKTNGWLIGALRDNYDLLPPKVPDEKWKKELFKNMV